MVFLKEGAMCFKVNRVFGAVWCDRPRGRTWGTNPALVSAGTRLGGGALVPGRAKLSRKVWAGGGALRGAEGARPSRSVPRPREAGGRPLGSRSGLRPGDLGFPSQESVNSTSGLRWVGSREGAHRFPA